MTPDTPWKPKTERHTAGLPPSWFGGYRYQRLRRIARYRTGAVAPTWMQGWRTLKEAGESFRSIAIGTGWTPSRKKQPRGSFSPSAIRGAFKDWGWDTGKQGVKVGRNSLLVRVARLETQLRDIARWLKDREPG